MRVPKYRRHPNGQAFVQHKSIQRPGNRIYLGKHGTPESRQKYREFINQLMASGGEEPIPESPKMQDLILAYWDHAEEYYGDHREKHHMKTVLRTVREFYGSELAIDFGPRKLKTLRDYWVGQDYARTTCNRYVNRVRRFVRWCVSEELIPASIAEALATVDPLRKGKTEARETEPVTPVALETVRATLPYVSSTVAAMIEVQYLCGMRPAEVTIMRPCDIQRSPNDEHLPGGASVWLYLPESHKNEWRDQSLIKAVPSAAQSILMQFWNREPEEYLFSPRDAYRELRSRKPPTGKHKIGAKYSTDSYRRAITYGIRKAHNAGVRIESWSPNQLRHAIYTWIRQRVGADAALHWCGHATLETGDIYFERQSAELTRVAQLLDSELRITQAGDAQES